MKPKVLCEANARGEKPTMTKNECYATDDHGPYCWNTRWRDRFWIQSGRAERWSVREGQRRQAYGLVNEIGLDDTLGKGQERAATIIEPLAKLATLTKYRANGPSMAMAICANLMAFFRGNFVCHNIGQRPSGPDS